MMKWMVLIACLASMGHMVNRSCSDYDDEIKHHNAHLEHELKLAEVEAHKMALIPFEDIPRYIMYQDCLEKSDTLRGSTPHLYTELVDDCAEAFGYNVEEEE